MYNENGNLIQENLTIQDIQHFLLDAKYNLQDKRQQQPQPKQQQHDEQPQPSNKPNQGRLDDAELNHIQMLYQTMKTQMDLKLAAQTSTPRSQTSTTEKDDFNMDANIHSILNRVQGIMTKAHQQLTSSNQQTVETTTTEAKTASHHHLEQMYQQAIPPTQVIAAKPVSLQGGISGLINNVLTKSNVITQPPTNQVTPLTTTNTYTTPPFTITTVLPILTTKTTSKTTLSTTTKSPVTPSTISKKPAEIPAPWKGGISDLINNVLPKSKPVSQPQHSTTTTKLPSKTTTTKLKAVANRTTPTIKTTTQIYANPTAAPKTSATIATTTTSPTTPTTIGTRTTTTTSKALTASLSSMSYSGLNSNKGDVIEHGRIYFQENPHYLGVAESDKSKKTPLIFKVGHWGVVNGRVNTVIFGAMSHAPNFSTFFLSWLFAAGNG